MNRPCYITKVAFEGEEAQDVPRIQKVTPEYFMSANGYSEEDVRAIAALAVDELYIPKRRGVVVSVRRVA